MESVGAFPDAEWDSISRMLNGDQGFDHAPHLLGQYPFSHERGDSSVISSTFCPSLEASMGGATDSSFCSLGGLSSGLQYIFQESSIGSGECYYFNDCGDVMSTDVYMAGEKSSSFAAAFPNTSMDEPARVDDSLGNPFDGQLPAMAVPDREWQLKRKFVDTEGSAILSENPKKTARASRAVQEIPKPKKTRKVVSNGKDEEESNAVQDPQSSSSCSSEGNIASEEPETPSTLMTVSGKTRASRGSATDPQSLYARKRREKINERLRTLQTLVPNGTKVDISTMLEEAVQYVKFLQLQIKLLSSDDTWMYAPIAYNGMDLGLSSRMSPASL